MRGKKYIRKIILVITLVCCIALVNSQELKVDAASKVALKEFYTVQINDECMQYLESYLPSIVPEITKDLLNYGNHSSLLMLGSPISVGDSDSFFYIPLMCNGQVVYIISIFETGDSNTPYAITYGKMFADILNDLPVGKYCLEAVGESVFVVGENNYIQIDGPHKEISSINSMYKKDLVSQEAFLEKQNVSDMEFVRLIEYVGSVKLSAVSRSINTNSLSIPYVANGGSYCWLASSASILSYYGYNINLDTAHKNIHSSSHTLNNCTGGSKNDAYGVLNYYGHLKGSISSTKCTWGQVMSFIDNGSPLYTSWGYYEGSSRKSGHAMVVCGYSFNDIAGTITYTIRDPNTSQYRYVTGAVNASEVYCSVGNRSYKWDGGIYNIRR